VSIDDALAQLSIEQEKTEGTEEKLGFYSCSLDASRVPLLIGGKQRETEISLLSPFAPVQSIHTTYRARPLVTEYSLFNHTPKA
jgi:hypothetical protein